MFWRKEIEYSAYQAWPGGGFSLDGPTPHTIKPTMQAEQSVQPNAPWMIFRKGRLLQKDVYLEHFEAPPPSDASGLMVLLLPIEVPAF
jgi:hypothetical protein